MNTTKTHQWTREQDTIILEQAGKQTYVAIAKGFLGLNKDHIRGRYQRLISWFERWATEHPGRGHKAQRIEKFLTHLHSAAPVKVAGEMADKPEETMSVAGDADHQTITMRRVQAKTQEGAFATAKKDAGIDEDIWTITSWKAKRYQGFYRSRSYQADPQRKNDWRREATVLTMWSVELVMVRRVPTEKENIQALRDLLIQEMKAHSPVVRPYSYVHVAMSTPTFMYEVNIPDLHAGKLCWGMETGTNYNTAAAASLFDLALIDLMGRVQSLKLDEIILPLGNDFFHTDNPDDTTAGGTAMNVDDRWFKTFKRMKGIVVNGVERLRTIAPVKIIIVPGNHDATKMLYLGDTIESWFHNYANVAVDNSPMERKYHKYGDVLLGLAHGDAEKMIDYPILMAQEAKPWWGSCKHYEWHVGHLHNRAARKQQVRPVENTIEAHTNFGVTIRTLPSLAGTDKWHYKHGFVKNPRAAEAYLWSPTSGYAGHNSYNYWGEPLANIGSVLI